ncbi:LLM class oxidoreductase [Williamsia sterculiae]|uniref:Luciferase-like monooxygenase n=1 Tax=Williamsia sterculiae TaxID=1344003 RepID=A0A1N7D0D3_9NOCA|nr:LLM class flavin-dependent oxidoreductase [Williamsia sterculiae]SIR69291.1 Luciferase-like monooxygenase [Williamsia sterculiae]
MSGHAEPYLALGLNGAQLVELTSDDALLRRWDALPLGFTVLGLDRIDPFVEPAEQTLDASAVGAILGPRTSGARFLIAAAAHRDHPYNLARRVTSLGHLSGGRSGLVIGQSDRYAPSTDRVRGTWRGTTGDGVALTADTALAAAHAVRALEQSWPFDSIVADRETGILIQADRIAHVDLDDVFSIAGPLNAPTPAAGVSVIGWYGDDAPVDPGIDLSIGSGGYVREVALGADLPSGDCCGILLRPGPTDPLRVVFDEAERLLSVGLRPIGLGTAIRAAVDLPMAPGRPAAVRAAFPVPQPHPAL